MLDALTYAGSIDNLPTDIKRTNDDRLQFWYGDVRNGPLVNSLASQSDAVVHFAAETHVTRSVYDNLRFFETDVLGTQVIANAVLNHASRIRMFIHISSSEVYGTARTQVMDEDHALMPMSPYAAAKAGADRLVYSYGATYGIPAVILRPFNNFGSHQHLEKAIPRFITSCILDEPLTVHGDGAAERDWVYVRDCCRAIDLCLHADPARVRGEVINIGTGVSISVARIAEMIIEKMGKPRDLMRSIENRPGQVERHTSSTSKAKDLLGWRATMSFGQGLDQTIEWYRKNRHIWEKQLWMRCVPINLSNGTTIYH